MKADTIISMFETYQTDELNWIGNCHDCGATVSVLAKLASETEIEITGGAVYQTDEPLNSVEPEVYLKCSECHGKDRVLRNFRPCEVYSRVVGYLRPIGQWNDGKRAEYSARKMFELP